MSATGQEEKLSYRSFPLTARYIELALPILDLDANPSSLGEETKFSVSGSYTVADVTTAFNSEIYPKDYCRTHWYFSKEGRFLEKDGAFVLQDETILSEEGRLKEGTHVALKEQKEVSLQDHHKQLANNLRQRNLVQLTDSEAAALSVLSIVTVPGDPIGLQGGYNAALLFMIRRWSSFINPLSDLMGKPALDKYNIIRKNKNGLFLWYESYFGNLPTSEASRFAPPLIKASFSIKVTIRSDGGFDYAMEDALFKLSIEKGLWGQLLTAAKAKLAAQSAWTDAAIVAFIPFLDDSDFKEYFIAKLEQTPPTKAQRKLLLKAYRCNFPSSSFTLLSNLLADSFIGMRYQDEIGIAANIFLALALIILLIVLSFSVMSLILFASLPSALLLGVSLGLAGIFLTGAGILYSLMLDKDLVRDYKQLLGEPNYPENVLEPRPSSSLASPDLRPDAASSLQEETPDHPTVSLPSPQSTNSPDS